MMQPPCFRQGCWIFNPEYLTTLTASGYTLRCFSFPQCKPQKTLWSWLYWVQVKSNLSCFNAYILIGGEWFTAIAKYDATWVGSLLIPSLTQNFYDKIQRLLKDISKDHFKYSLPCQNNPCFCPMPPIHTSTQRKYTGYFIHTPRFPHRGQPATTRANTAEDINNFCPSLIGGHWMQNLPK